MNVVFAIPSYKRGKEQLTAEYLHNMGYPREQIYISTQTEEDYAEYQKNWSSIATIIYKKGECVGDNRNSLLEALKEQKYIVMLDDDIKAIEYLKDGLTPITEKHILERHIGNAFMYCEQNNALMWGVYPVRNAFFMSKKAIVKSLLIGTVLGIINKGYRFDREFKVKEDYELCCRIMNERKNVVRLNFLTANAKHKTAGGCMDDWKSNINEKCCRELVNKYPNIVKNNAKRKDEVLIRRDIK